MQNFHQFSLTEFTKWCEESGEKSFRAKQVWDWVYKKLVSDWDAMNNLGSSFKKILAEKFSLQSLELSGTEESKDGQTVKFLWELKDGRLVESVLIFAPGRRTVCVSCQVGCPARCAFCASGKEGLMRNLKSVEIFEQVYLIERWLLSKGLEPVSNIVYMGMGEPLENYDEVVSSVKRFCDPLQLDFSERKITVSTVGVVEKIKQLAGYGPKVNLVLSLHAPNQQVRKKIIPYARKYPLEDVLEAMRQYAEITGRDITYEYTLLAGINDAPEHASELADLVKGDPCTVNLIPYNPVVGLNLQRPGKESIEQFREILESKGIVVTWRYTKGKDIAAACGQLALKKSSALAVL